ncbi:type II secretion system protein [bacterium]|nr:MAG: type II secretion system protein [bacterium]
MNENKYCEKGFTLIEMLVVVAVIGLLSSVILTALGPAKDKAKDSRIIQEVNQVRSIAETLYNGNYGALESLPSTNIRNLELKALSDDISAQLPVGAVGLTIIKSLPAPARIYVTFSSLNTKGGDPQNPVTQYYCVDSAGHSGIRNLAPTGPVCPSN